MYFNFGTGHTFNMYWHRHTLRIKDNRSCPEAHILIRQNKNAVLVKFLHYSNSYYNYVTKTITIYTHTGQQKIIGVSHIHMALRTITY